MDDFHCSFCGKRRREVVKLISGPRVFICNECVALCLRYIEKDKQKAPGSDGGEATVSNKLSCNFCGRSQDHDEVERLIAGPTVNICNACLDICVDIIEEKFQRLEPSKVADPSPRPSPASVKGSSGPLAPRSGERVRERGLRLQSQPPGSGSSA